MRKINASSRMEKGHTDSDLTAGGELINTKCVFNLKKAAKRFRVICSILFYLYERAPSKLTGKYNHTDTNLENYYNNNKRIGGWTNSQWGKPCLRK